MAKIYAALIRKGLKTPDDVPARLRDAVAALLQEDAHCNGDMHAALDYAAAVKHQQREFVAKRGSRAIIN